MRAAAAAATLGAAPRRAVRGAARGPLSLRRALSAAPAPRLALRTGVCTLPRQQRTPAPVEDAFFTAHVAHPHGGPVVSYVGVADGVGAWRGRGVDPRLYAQRLMEAASEAVWSAALARTRPPPAPAQVLQAAWEATNAAEVVGSATAIVLMLDESTGE